MAEYELVPIKATQLDLLVLVFTLNRILLIENVYNITRVQRP